VTDDASRWHRVKGVLQAALEQAPVDQARFLDDACRGDPDLRMQVESLLIAHAAAGDFVERPAIESLGPLSDGGSTDRMLHSGDRLGPYQIGEQLGAGGMGEVYEALDARLGRTVAIKVLPPYLRDNPDLKQRFEREAKTLAALSHPHICQVFDVGEQDGVNFLVMEYLDGPTLADRLAESALSTKESLAIATQIADALDGAHERAIIHRDLKPSNIKITPAGVVKVLDFGLAKDATGDGSSIDPSQPPHTTGHGTGDGAVLGTASYMSPEQAVGKTVDKRTDIWAFGCVLYEMLTGKRAFAGATVSETIAAILDREPDWQALPASTPPHVRRLLERCLEKDPRQRLRDIGDLSAELGRTPGPTTFASSGSRLRQLLMTGISLAIGATLIVWTGLSRPLFRQAASRFITGAAEDAASQLVLGPPTRLSGGDEVAIEPSISPDGRFVAYSAGTATHMRVLIRTLAGGRAIPLSDDSGEFQFQPRWSPDGSQILYITPEGALPS
jgi:eukaryotic-like serine/threonine-protein kinase